MTIKIEINVPEDAIKADAARQYLSRAMTAIGFTDAPQRPNNYDRVVHAEDAPVSFQPNTPAQTAEPEAHNGPLNAQSVGDLEAKANEQAPQRERGKPAPGKARRTKAEIEEDEAADAADAGASGVSETTNDTPAISTGEERISPEDEAAAEQDAADEAADPANAPSPTATRDDVRAAMVKYSQAKDMAALTMQLTAIFKDKWPDGSVTKLSEIPEDAAAFQSVIDALNAKMEG